MIDLSLLFRRLFTPGWRGRRIGLALGGGGVLGAAHIGVLKALEENEIVVERISGTSVGAFVSALYAFGVTPDRIEAAVLDLNWLDISSFSFSAHGFLSNQKLGDVFRRLAGDASFADAKIPLSIVAADIETGEKTVFGTGRVDSAIMASACIPGVFIPVEIDGKMFVDGGVVENVPVSPLLESGCRTVVGVNLIARRAYRKPANILDVLANSLYIMVGRTEARHEKADLVIAPRLGRYSFTDFRQVPELIQAGYAAARKAISTA